MKLYAIDVTIHATAYVKADSADEARNKAVATLKDRQADLVGSHTSELRYDDPALPEVSLSPAMTIGDVGNEAWEAA